MLFRFFQKLGINFTNIFGTNNLLECLIHSIKTAIACSIGYFTTRLIGFSAGPWVIITIIVVMLAQIYVGSVVSKAYYRFLGTLLGCLFATITLTAFEPTDLVIATTIILISFIFSFIATTSEALSYAGTLGAVTTIIIMLNPNPTISVALERFLEISLGIFIATLVSQFVLPIHASSHIRTIQAQTLEQLKNYYQTCMMFHVETFTYQDLDENIVKLLSKQRQLAKEATREPLTLLYAPLYFIQTLQCEKEILRAIDFMHYALLNVKKARKILEENYILQKFNTAILETFNLFIKMIEGEKTLTNISIPSLNPFKENIQNNLSLLSQEEMIHMNGFVFAASMLTDSLTKLKDVYSVLSRKNMLD